MSIDHIYHDKAGSIKKGGYLLLKNVPCRVIEVHKSKPGKHGSAKIRFVGLDVFTRRKYEDFMPSAGHVEVPEVHKLELKVQVLKGNQVTCTAADGKSITLPLPTAKTMSDFVEDLKERVRDGLATIVIVLQCMGDQAIVGFRGFSGTSDDETALASDSSESDDS